MAICTERIISNTIQVFYEKNELCLKSFISEVECIFRKFNFRCTIKRFLKCRCVLKYREQIYILKHSQCGLHWREDEKGRLKVLYVLPASHTTLQTFIHKTKKKIQSFT